MRSLFVAALFAVAFSIPALAETNSSQHTRAWEPRAQSEWKGDPYAPVAKKHHDAWVAKHGHRGQVKRTGAKQKAMKGAATPSDKASWWSRNFGKKDGAK